MNILDGPFVVPGFTVGHWTHQTGKTGCTVIVADRLVNGAVETRGGAPGTRETTLLEPGRTVQGLDALVLSGGSAFGLAAADGVMQYLHEQGRGYTTGSIPVPIVTEAVIFDLTGDNPVWPDRSSGYWAAANTSAEWTTTRNGAGAGAMVSKCRGRHAAVRSGIGVAQVATPAGTISALIVNNAFGDVVDRASGERRSRPKGVHSTEDAITEFDEDPELASDLNTVIGAIVCDRPVDHDGLTRLTIAASAGIAQSIHPAHTPFDGDTVFVLAAGSAGVTGRELLQLTIATQNAVARAIVNSISTAT